MVATSDAAAGPEVVAVLVNWNGLDDTIACLDSLATGDFRGLSSIVVDNGSTDGSVELLRSRDDVRLIELGANVGKAAADRCGISAALEGTCDYVLVLNSDTIVAPDMVSMLVQAAEADPAAGVLGPKMLYASDPDMIWFAGGRIHRLRGDASHIGQHERDDGRWDELREVDYVTSCAMLVRRGVFRDIGSIDAEYFIYFDETDFCVRAAERGWKVVYIPQARLWHKVSATVGARSSTYWYRYMRSRMLFIRKRFPLPRRVAAYLSIVSFDIPRATVHFVRRGEPDRLRAYLAGARRGLFERLDEGGAT